MLLIRRFLKLQKEEEFANEKGAQGWVSFLHVGLRMCADPYESLPRQLCICKCAVSAGVHRRSATALFTVQHNNDVWHDGNWWKSPTTFRGSKDAQMLYKKCVLPFNCISSWRRLNNTYPGLNHLGHWSKLNQAFNDLLPLLLFSIMLEHLWALYIIWKAFGIY